MKNKAIYFLIALAGLLGACSNDEDTTPTDLESVNKFAPADGDNSAEATLRRNFYKETGCYLLFNDTLSVTKTGEDAYGKPIYKVETIDLPFSFIGESTSDYTYTYDYIKDETVREKAADFVKTKLLARLGKLAPYSVLLVNSISVWQTVDGSLELLDPDEWPYEDPHPDYYLGSRCYAFSLQDGEAFDDEGFFDSVVSQILYDRIHSKGDAFLSDFTGLVSKYESMTSADKEEIGQEYGKNLDWAHSLGFLKDSYYYTVSQTDDLKSYIDAICTTTVEDFEKQYGKYPICVERFKVLRNKVLEMGVKLD